MDIPTAKNASQGYSLVIDNAKRHFLCGDMLSKAGEHGPAVSHMVLAAEESIKATILIAMSHGLEAPPSSIRPFLTSHLPRQAAGALWALMDFLLDRWISLITSLNNRFQGDMGPEYQQARAVEVAALVSELNQLADAAPGESEFIDLLLWWNQSESLKQHGFYVDFRNEAWLSPSLVTEEDFAQARRVAEETIAHTEKAACFFASVPREEYQQLQELLSSRIRQAHRGPDSAENVHQQ